MRHVETDYSTVVDLANAATSWAVLEVGVSAHAVPGEFPFAATGTVKPKVAPDSAFGAAHIRPPCASMTVRLTDNPKPVPPALVV
jgi:hypothetical protein